MKAERLREVLLRMPLQDVVVELDGRPWHWVARVTSPSFVDEPAHSRQARVWDHLLRELSDAEIAEVEYIFTVTPDERNEAASPRQAVG